MSIPLESLIIGTLKERSGTVTISNMRGKIEIDFSLGLDLSSLKAKHAAKLPLLKEKDSNDCLLFLSEQKELGFRNKESLRGKLHEKLGRLVPSRTFNAAYKHVFGSERGRPVKLSRK